MTTQVEVNVLEEIARAAYLLKGLEDDHFKLHNASRDISFVTEEMHRLASTTSTLFHHLTQLLVERGQDIPCDDEELSELIETFRSVAENRRDLWDKLRPPFGAIGDVIEHWS